MIDFRGGSRIFSRGADFQKIFENFDDIFFRSTKLIFPNFCQFFCQFLPQLFFVPIFANFFAPQANFWKNRPKNAFLGTFWKILTEKLRFFGARSPLKISVYWRQRRLLKNFRVGRPKMDFLKSIKGGSAGGRIPEEREGRPSPPPPAPHPKSAPDRFCSEYCSSCLESSKTKILLQ